MGLEFHLLASQLRLIGLNLAQTTANLSRLLCSHAAVFVKVHWLVRHNCLPFFPTLAIPILRSGASGGFRKQFDQARAAHRRSALTLEVVGDFTAPESRKCRTLMTYMW
jgi:hypothetical protein